MPKIIVLVDKDDKGKLWNYVFTGEDKAMAASAQLNVRLFMIHKSEESAENIQQSIQKSPAEHENIIVGMFPLSKKHATYKTRGK